MFATRTDPAETYAYFMGFLDRSGFMGRPGRENAQNQRASSPGIYKPNSSKEFYSYSSEAHHHS